MNAPRTIEKHAQLRRDVAKAIEADPIAVYREHVGPEASELKNLPAHMRPGIARYVILGIKPGSFLCAIFAHEFGNAQHRADEQNLACLHAYSDFLRFACPSECWGSSDKVRAWCEAGGLLARDQVE